jgi:hypothetical protein
VYLQYVTLLLPQSDLQLLNTMILNQAQSSGLSLDLPETLTTTTTNNNNSNTGNASTGTTGGTTAYSLTRAAAQALQAFDPVNSTSVVTQPGPNAAWLAGGLGVKSAGWYGIGFQYVSVTHFACTPAHSSSVALLPARAAMRHKLAAAQDLPWGQSNNPCLMPPFTVFVLMDGHRPLRSL